MFISVAKLFEVKCVVMVNPCLKMPGKLLLRKPGVETQFSHYREERRYAGRLSI